MQFKTILSVLSIAIAATARPSPTTGKTTASSCDAPDVVACCNAVSENGTGVGCIFSTLNILNPTCASSQSLACCSAPETALINIECIPISISL